MAGRKMRSDNPIRKICNAGFTYLGNGVQISDLNAIGFKG